jgi:hypothetical protein
VHAKAVVGDVAGRTHASAPWYTAMDLDIVVKMGEPLWTSTLRWKHHESGPTAKDTIK